MYRDSNVSEVPRDDEFSQEQWKRIDEIIARFRDKPGALIPVLEQVQEVSGYLPEVIQRRVAFGMKIPLSQVYGVVTFYSFFTMTPRGKYQLRVCLGTACHVRGGQRIVDEIENNLGICPGECTRDMNFSLDIIRCLGACGVAPVMMVNDKIHKQVKAPQMSQTLHQYQ